MTSKQIARVDGLPSLIVAERVWPVPAPSGALDRAAERLTRAQRARVARQTAVVHECRLPVWARGELAELVAEQERAEIRSELRAAGLM